MQVLQVLCRIDAIDVTDMASAMVLLTNTGRSGEVKRLAEGLYKLAKVPLQNTDKDQIIRVLVDYYALVEGDLSIARDLVEGQPALSAVSITLLIIRCVEMAQAISSASRAEAATASLYSIQAVVQNPVAFANVVLLLKECLVSAEYGVSARSSHRSQEDDSDSDSGFHGRNKRPHAQVVMTDTSLPAKREISSLLTSLGTALRSFMSRRVGRWAQVDSDLSSAGSASTDSSAPHAGAEVERREQSAGYSVDLHVMFACYLHGSGDPKQVHLSQ